MTLCEGKKFKIVNKEQCDEVLGNLDGKPYTVSSVKKSVTYGRPQPPFTTSTMQQDAVNKLKMSSTQVMQIAQQLYEGIDIAGQGHLALVTYIRTDSVRVSDDAVHAARNYIREHYGDRYVPASPNVYASKKQAQDAHEAIRPINLDITPDSLKDKLQRNQYNLYKLIYNRFLASQASRAVFDSVAVDISCDKYTFTATGKTVVFDGYMAIYASEEKSSKKAKAEDDTNTPLPQLEEGDVLKLIELLNEQKFTKAPSRYTEASIIKAMEELGIGRPSTFATIMATLYKREYVVKDNKSLVPTELGTVVTEYLEKHFKDIVDVDFTAEMESRLDSIEDNSAVWYEVVDDFYKPLCEEVKKALKTDRVVIQDQPSDEICEKCGSPMVYKVGPYGKYLACSNYPNCTNRRSLTQKSAPKQTDIKCELCGAPMLEREGKFGKYLSCSNYPKCKNTRSISEAVAKCPQCGKDVVKKFTRGGKVFYGCSGYPACNFVSWDLPTGKLCPKCNQPLVYRNSDKTKGIVCSNKQCDYTE